MKFHQLVVGDRFQLNGNTYTKVGPLTATKDGANGPQMIPRSANVKTTGTSPTKPGTSAEINIKTVMTEFDRFYVQCTDLMTGIANPDSLEKTLATLESARQRFMANVQK